MAVLTTCTGCKKPLSIPDSACGRPVRCPHCSAVFMVKAIAPRPPAPPPAPARPASPPAAEESLPEVLPADKPLPPAPDFTPIRFQVRILKDADRVLRGRLQARWSSEGLRLRRGKAQALLIPTGNRSRYLGGNRLSAQVGQRRVDLAILGLRLAQPKLAQDLAAFLNGDRSSPDPRGYVFPWYLLALAALPLGIPILTLGGALPCALGFGLAAGCFTLLQRGNWPAWARVLTSLGLTGLGYAVVGALVLAALLERDMQRKNAEPSAWHRERPVPSVPAPAVPAVANPAPAPPAPIAGNPVPTPKPPEPPPDPTPLWRPPNLPVRLDIHPPPMARDREEVLLPCAARDVVIGGGGRYLIVVCAPQHQLAVFDANEGRLVRTLPLPEDTARVAAGIDKLFVALPKASRIERYDLPTLSHLAWDDLPEPPVALCMGSASRGPLLLQTKPKPEVLKENRTLFLDPVSLTPVRLNVDKPVPLMEPSLMRASADGQVFAGRGPAGGEPHTVSTVVLHGADATVHTVSTPSAILCPAPDGRYVYGGCGVYTEKLDPVFPNPIPQSFPKAFIPAEHGPYFMKLDWAGWEQHGGKLAFFREGEGQPFAESGPVEGVTNEQVSYGNLRDTLAHDRRVHVIPDANLIVTVPKSNDRLILYRFDVKAAARKAGG